MHSFEWSSSKSKSNLVFLSVDMSIVKFLGKFQVDLLLFHNVDIPFVLFRLSFYVHINSISKQNRRSFFLQSIYVMRHLTRKPVYLQHEVLPVLRFFHRPYSIIFPNVDFHLQFFKMQEIRKFQDIIFF